MSSIFSKIISGEIPCHKIYEDRLTFAFLDINPVQKGHVLVIPKKEVDNLFDLEEEDYNAVMNTVKKVAKQIEAVLKPRRVGLHVEGFDVPHAHVHVIPINNGFKDFTPPKPSEPDHETLARVATDLKIES